jgi:hypothetical protein
MLGLHGDVLDLTSSYISRDPAFSIEFPLCESPYMSEKAFRRYKQKHWKTSRLNGYDGTLSLEHLDGYVVCEITNTQYDYRYDSRLGDDIETIRTTKKTHIVRIGDFYNLWNYLYYLYETSDESPECVFTFYLN